MNKPIPESELVSKAIGEEKFRKLFTMIANQNPKDVHLMMRAIAEAFADHIDVSERMARVIIATAEWSNGNDTVSFLLDTEMKELYALEDIVGLPIARQDLKALQARLKKLHKMRDDLHTLTILLKDVHPSKQLKEEIAEVESSIQMIQRNHAELHPSRINE